MRSARSPRTRSSPSSLGRATRRRCGTNVVEVASRVEQELELLRRNFPHLEYVREGNWVRLPCYHLPGNMWDRDWVEVCFQIPERIPGQPPYGFYVRPGLALRSGQPIGNYAFPAPTAFGADWGKFSWQ